MKEVIDRVPTRPNRIKLTSESDGSINYYAWERADEPTVDGTPINKELFDSIGTDITSLQQTMQKNTSDIATNKANIATNTSDIDNVKCGEYGAGKNLINVSPREITSNGITIKSSDNIITLNGTNTGMVNTSINFVDPILLNGTYTISGGISQIQLYFSDTIDGSITQYFGSDNKTFTVTNKYAIQLFIFIEASKQLTFNNQQFKIQLEKGSTATDYEPYIKSLNRLNEDKAEKSDLALLKQLKPVTLGTSWSQDTTNGYYTQTVAFSGITSKDNPTIDVLLSGTLAEMQNQQDDWGKILKVETSSNTLKFFASKPTTVSLSVMVKGV